MYVLLFSVFLTIFSNNELYQIFSKFDRPFSVLDLTKNIENVKYVDSLTKDFDFTYIYFSDHVDNFVSKSQKFTILNKFPSDIELYLLSQCDHFDVVLIDCNYVNSNSWKYISDLGFVSIFLNINDLLLQNIKDCLGCWGRSFQISEKDSCLIIYSNIKIIKLSVFSFLPMDSWVKTHEIYTDFSNKFFYKNMNKINWINGINLATCLNFDIIYPSRFEILQKILKKFDFNHNDFRLWHVIIQGTDTKFIDNDDRFCGCEEKFSNLCNVLYNVIYSKDCKYKIIKYEEIPSVITNMSIDFNLLPYDAIREFKRINLI
jgi:hypothetical protein